MFEHEELMAATLVIGLAGTGLAFILFIVLHDAGYNISDNVVFWGMFSMGQAPAMLFMLLMLLRKKP